jgi:hypothetical protein
VLVRTLNCALYLPTLSGHWFVFFTYRSCQDIDLCSLLTDAVRTLICVLYLPTLSISQALYCRKVEWSVSNKLEIYGRKRSWPNQGKIPEYSCRHWWKPRKPSVRIASDPAEIQTEHLSNESLVLSLHPSEYWRNRRKMRKRRKRR